MSVLETMFSVIPQADDKPATHLEIDFQEGEFAGDAMPSWLSGHVARTGCQGDEVRMFYGPSGESAAFFEDGAFFCAAWASCSGESLHLTVKRRSEQSFMPSIQTVVVPVLRDIMAARGSILMHAASLVCPDQTGVIISAMSGGSKTTTALSMVRLGAKLLGDDLTVMRMNNDYVTAWGFPKPLNLTAETLSFFEEMSAVPPPFENGVNPGKVTIKPQTLYGEDCLARSCKPGVIYFTEIARSGPSVEPLNVRETVATLVQAHTFAYGQKLQKAAMSCIFALLDQVRIFRLLTGPDPVALGQWLMRHAPLHATGKRCGDEACLCRQDGPAK